MTTSDLLIVDRDNAISETLDGEVVIIHLHSGAYYSADALGTELWGAFERGTTLEALANDLAQRFDADDGVIGQALEDFAATLRREGLIKPADSTDPPGSNPVEPKPSAETHDPKPPFRAPVFEVYEDLRELLHADPIHDVMNAGWPQLREDAE